MAGVGKWKEAARRRQGRRPRVVGWASSAPRGDCRAAVILQSHCRGWGRRGGGDWAFRPHSCPGPRGLRTLSLKPWLGRFAEERGGSLVPMPRTLAGPWGPGLAPWKGHCPCPRASLSGLGSRMTRGPRGQVEHARGGLRPSDSLWCHRGHRQHALSLVFVTFLAVSFPFYGGWLDFVFCHRLPVRPYRLTAATSGFPRLPMFAPERNTGRASEGGQNLNPFRERDCLRWRKK